MLVNIREVQPLLHWQDATADAIELVFDADRLVSARTGTKDFQVVGNQPVLIDFASSIVDANWFEAARKNYSLIGHRLDLPRGIKSRLFGTARISARNVARLSAMLKTRCPARPVVLIVGAGQRGIGSRQLYEDPAIALVAFDVYPSSITTFVADAHRIPLADASVDAVCVQAVLEHVLDPAAVVAEIERVLKPGGLVYAETPFMQQVHEGAYDFTRFSELAHRWLFRNFRPIDRGALGGPGVTVFWSMKHFFWALTRSKRIGNLLSLPFAIFVLFDRLIPKAHAIDGANCVYLLGRKEPGCGVLESIVGDYLGAQR